MDFDYIKQGIADFIKSLYPDATIYEDAIQQGAASPSFFVDFFSADGTARLAETSSFAVGCVITYYPKDIRTNDEINAVRFNLLQHLRRFYTPAGWMTVKNLTASVTDMILTVTFTVQVDISMLPDDPLIQAAQQKTELKEG
ncbi:phage tail terminator family protein [Acetanaerobacterium elongatum]|uniref:Uncharacterized protein n=1 Tax=Acetanaerobacterium elongatum TaxID=258515 RepID=A0A1G9Z1C3_9FIRM|nr:hypothetical protein [Acetanaerobacterium elongatum]SDN15192.1 hypothetical protein SAMN05192585_11259 [Acetanaerobacterium elongatum]